MLSGDHVQKQLSAGSAGRQIEPQGTDSTRTPWRPVGNEGLAAADEPSAELVLAEVRMSGLGGYSLLEHLRAR